MGTIPPQQVTPQRPNTPRVHAFVDGQNLYHRVKTIFGYEYPNFDLLCLAERIVRESSPDRELVQVHFYTGIHSKRENKFWHDFWTRKITAMRGKGIRTITRPLMYARVETPAGVFNKGFEKGIDMRIGLDLVRFARSGEYDVALIFSQDSDLAEAVEEIKRLRQGLNRWIIVESAFPSGPALGQQRGIPGSQWRPFSKTLYDACIDPADYRSPRAEA